MRHGESGQGSKEGEAPDGTRKKCHGASIGIAAVKRE